MSLAQIRASFEAQEITKPDFIDRMHAEHARLFEYAEWIKRTDIARIEISDGQVVMTSRADGIRIVCASDDKRIAPIEILNFMDYEKSDSEMIYRLVRDGDSILDIGANIGWYSIGLAKRYPHCSVSSFEPIPRTFDYLRRNVALNGAANIAIHNHGFSDREAELTFYYYPTGSGNASSAKLADVSGVQEVKARVLPLDACLAGRSRPVDFIKCDVEGAELLVFKGAVRTLEADKPVVFSEMLRKWSAKFNYHPNEIIALFAGLGYACFTAKDGRLAEFTRMDEETVETNFFFLHRLKHAAVLRDLS